MVVLSGGGEVGRSEATPRQPEDTDKSGGVLPSPPEMLHPRQRSYSSTCYRQRLHRLTPSLFSMINFIDLLFSSIHDFSLYFGIFL